MLSMNVFQQTSRPNLLYFPSSSASSCHGRRRISPHNPPLLVSFPATKMKFNPKSLHLVHGIQHSSSKHLLASTATMKFSRVLFALPRDNEEFSSDNEEEPTSQEHKEHDSSISSIKQSKKVEFVVRETRINIELAASAWLKARVLYGDGMHQGSVSPGFGSYIKQERALLMRRYKERNIKPFMCVIVIRKEGELYVSFEDVIGTLDFRVEDHLPGKTYPEEVVMVKMIKSFNVKQGEPCKYGIIWNVTVIKSARRQGVGSSMLKFVIDFAEENDIQQVLWHVKPDDEPALALCEKMGFTMLELLRDNEEFSSDNKEAIIEEPDDLRTSTSSADVYEEQSKKVSGAEIIQLTRDNEGAFSSDNKEEPTIQEHDKLRTLISSDNLHEEQLKIVSSADDELKKLKFVVREATNDIEHRSSAALRARGLPDRMTSELTEIKSKSMMSPVKPYMCVVALTEEGVCIGTLDFVVHNWSHGVPALPDQFKKEASPAYGVISNVVVMESDPLLGVRSSLLKFVIEKAEEYGITEIKLEVNRTDDAVLAVLLKKGLYDLYKYGSYG